MRPQSPSPPVAGLLFGLAAYGIWGFAPAYWKGVAHHAAPELLAHRILWSLGIALLLAAATGSFAELRGVFASRGRALRMALAALLLACNWLVFIWAVSVGQITATSLGYYLNPLLNVVLGLFVLGERLRRIQWIAVALAALGVAQHVASLGELPWIALVLAGSFSLYGLVRKTTPVAPIAGFAVETSLLALPALAWVAWLWSRGEAGIPVGRVGADAFIAASGLITAAPLICFNAAAKRLPLVSVGILQYLAPSIALLLAVLAYGEPFEAVHARTFGCVWLALAIFTTDAALEARAASARARAAAAAATTTAAAAQSR